MLRPLLALTILLALGCVNPVHPDEECTTVDHDVGDETSEVDTVRYDCPIIPE